MQFLRRIIQIRQKFFHREPRKSKLHQAKLVTTSSSLGKQTYILLDRANFKEKVVSSFLAADIPLHTLNHPALNLCLLQWENLCLLKLQPVQALLN